MMTGFGGDGGVLGVADDGMGGVTGLTAATVALMDPDDALQRSHSTSSIHDILHHSHRIMSPIERLESPFKSRSSSCDDIVSLSGSLTPTLTPSKMRFTL